MGLLLSKTIFLRRFASFPSFRSLTLCLNPSTDLSPSLPPFLPLSLSFSHSFSSSFSSQLIPLQSRPSFRSRFLPSHLLTVHLPLGDSLSPWRDMARQWPLLNPTQSSGSDLVRLCAALFARRLSPSRTKSRLCIPPPSFSVNFLFTSRDRRRYAICFVHFVQRTRVSCIDVSLFAIAADVEEDVRSRSKVFGRLIFFFFFFFFDQCIRIEKNTPAKSFFRSRSVSRNEPRARV